MDGGGEVKGVGAGGLPGLGATRRGRLPRPPGRAGGPRRTGLAVPLSRTGHAPPALVRTPTPSRARAAGQPAQRDEGRPAGRLAGPRADPRSACGVPAARSPALWQPAAALRAGSVQEDPCQPSDDPGRPSGNAFGRW